MPSPLFPNTTSRNGLPREFMDRVDLDTSPLACWLWKGKLDTDGYGQFHGRQAHRVAYEVLIGPIPKGLVLDHIVCRIRRCVSPWHTRCVSVMVNNLENSLSPPAVNAAKPWCLRGHPFDEENTYRRPDGRRHCRACQREANRRYLKRRGNCE